MRLVGFLICPFHCVWQDLAWAGSWSAWGRPTRRSGRWGTCSRPSGRSPRRRSTQWQFCGWAGGRAMGGSGSPHFLAQWVGGRLEVKTKKTQISWGSGVVLGGKKKKKHLWLNIKWMLPRRRCNFAFQFRMQTCESRGKEIKIFISFRVKTKPVVIEGSGPLQVSNLWATSWLQSVTLRWHIFLVWL